MVTTNSRQMTTGKAFEYALLSQFEEKLKHKTNIEVIKNSSFAMQKDVLKTLARQNKATIYLQPALQ